MRQTPNRTRPLSAADLARLADLRITFSPRLRPGAQIDGARVRFEMCSQHCRGLMALGANSYSLSFLEQRAEIGRYCSIARNVRITGNAHPVAFASTSPAFYNPKAYRIWAGERRQEPGPAFDDAPRTVWIGNDVWIGQDVLLRDGIRIGTGAVIAAGSVVSRDVAPYAVVGGAPAELIRMRFAPELCTRLLQSEWWRYALTDLETFDISNPEAFVLAVEHAQASGSIEPVPELRCTLHEYLSAAGSGPDEPSP